MKRAKPQQSGATDRGGCQGVTVRILFNRVSALVGQRTGIGHYAGELYRALRTHAGPDEVRGLPTRWSIPVNRWIGCHCSSEINRRIEQRTQQLQVARPTGSRNPFAWLGWQARRIRIGDRLRSCVCRKLQERMARHFRYCLTRDYCDLYHEPNYVPLECDVPTVITVCDVSPLLHPEWHPADRVAFFERSFRDGLKQCVHVLTISEFSRREIIHALGIAPERVTTTYLGARPGMRRLPAATCAPVLRRHDLSWGQYVLCVGTLEPRKNLDRLLRAYCDLPSELRSRCGLVLAGAWGWQAEQLREFYESEGRAKGVRHLGYTPETDLAALYSGARALAFPSLYEGFGLPPVEMHACGGAVLASTAAAVAEVLQGSQAALIEPHDLTAWRDALARAITDDDWLAGLRRGAEEHAARFSWDACAQTTMRVYRQLQGVDLTQALGRQPSTGALRAAG